MLNYCKITNEPINYEELLDKFSSSSLGGIVSFIGKVRNNSNNKNVTKLLYETNIAMATPILKNILSHAQDRWGPIDIAVEHRIGTLSLSETTLIIITGAAHREEAYSANRFILEEIKKELPIWKKEFFEDGTAGWVGWDNKA